MIKLLPELKNSSCSHRSIQAFYNVFTREKEKLKICWTSIHNVTVRFDCNTDPAEQDTKQDVLTNSESSENDNMNTNGGEMLTMSDLD